MAFAVCWFFRQGEAVSAGNRHIDPGQWQSSAHGLDKDLSAAIQCLFSDNSQVGDHDQSAVAVFLVIDVISLFLFGLIGIIGPDAEHKNPPATTVVLQVRAEIHEIVDGFARVNFFKITGKAGPFHHAVKVLVVDLRVAKPTSILSDQLVQLTGKYASNFHLNSGDALSHDAELPFAAKAEEGAIAHEFDHLWVIPAAKETEERIFEQVAANGFYLVVNLHHQLAFSRNVHLETVQGVERLGTGNLGKGNFVLQIGFLQFI